MDVLNATRRQSVLDKLETETYDLTIIGGGITGAGIALEAAAAGLKVALIEQKDYASGTSSKSTKLVHGGLRYLKQFAFNLVKEVGRERAIVHRMAPYLVIPEKMILPIYKNGSMSKFVASAAIGLYDFLAEVKGQDRKKTLNKKEAKQQEPLLNTQGLRGGVLYAEYRTDDARLTIDLLKTAVEIGDVTPINYTKCMGFSYDENGKIQAVKCLDSAGGNELSIKTKTCISAAGPWVDEVRQADRPDSDNKLILAKGIHLVFEAAAFPLQQSIYFDVPSDDRMIFAIPRADKVYVGTTDTFYKGDIDHFKITKNEVAYLLAAVNDTFPKVQLREEDVISSWAGVRPLIGKEEAGSASEISRKDEIFISDSGLISIAGGKLTGFRKMAGRALQKALSFFPSVQPADTSKIRLSGNKGRELTMTQIESEVKELADQVGYKWAEYLIKNYGLNGKDIANGCHESNLEKLWIQEVNYLIEREQACCTSDILNRRTGRLYFYPETIDEMEPIVRQALMDRGMWNEKLEKFWELEKRYAFEFF